MKKPLIGITLDSEKKDNYSKFPWYAIRKNYLHSIYQFGGLPFPLFNNNHSIKEIFRLLDALIIPDNFRFYKISLCELTLTCNN